MEVYPHPYLTHNSPDYLFLSFDNFNSITKAIINPIPPNNRTDAPYTVLINSRRPQLSISKSVSDTEIINPTSNPNPIPASKHPVFKELKEKLVARRGKPIFTSKAEGSSLSPIFSIIAKRSFLRTNNSNKP